MQGLAYALRLFRKARLAGARVLLAALLYGVRPADPLLLTVSAFIMLPAALTAIYLPARRASKVDPMVALRHE